MGNQPKPQFSVWCNHSAQTLMRPLGGSSSVDLRYVLAVERQPRIRWRLLFYEQVMVRPLVISFAMVVFDVFSHEEAKVPFAERNRSTQAFFLDRTDEPEWSKSSAEPQCAELGVEGTPLLAFRNLRVRLPPRDATAHDSSFF
jgi:hypothetical protein